MEGLTHLNGCEPIPITVKGPYTFSIGEIPLDKGQYDKGGVVTQVKLPKKFSFKSLKDSLKAEDCQITDFGKMERPAQIQTCFVALNDFIKKHGRHPAPWSASDAEEFVKIATESAKSTFGADGPELDEKLAATFSKVCSGNISPVAAAMGGLVAQEVLKAVSGKFMPIKQWLHYDALECLPRTDPTEEDCKPTDSRYDGQNAVFGKTFQDKLLKQKWFVVGAGAIGCELLKNFAMVSFLLRKGMKNTGTIICCILFISQIGLGAGPGGKLTVTDMDVIEKSNLNRQFLFRSRDVQKTKSSCAAKAIKAMNPGMNVEPQENRVGPETENIYDDDFFESLDGVANALDNVEARTYMDRRCVFYRLPLLESGTLGTKGNVQVVIPHLTESYSSSQDPPEKSIPICTLKNFPNQIEHTLQWARDMFEGTFSQSPQSALKFLAESDYLDKIDGQASQTVDTLETITQILKTEKPDNFDDCVAWARLLFQDLFHNQIKQLLHNFPPDQKTSTGAPFWSGPKRCPKPIVFDSSLKLHMDFVLSAANLRAEIYGLQGTKDANDLLPILKKVNVPEFKPKEGVKIAANDAEAEAMAQQNVSADQAHVRNL